MPLFKLLSILCLAFAFGVLVWTFVWIARLLAARAQAVVVETPPSAAEALAAAAAAAAARAEADEAERERKRTGTGVNAMLGLVLSVLACLLFWLSPLTLVLSAGGVWFSGNALWFGLRLFRVFVGRAAVGLVLGLASFGLHFGYRAGLFTLPF